MKGRNQLGTALVVVGVALFVLPAFFPVGTVLTHDTRPVTFDGPDELESNGVEVVAYGNLSDRGQELYVRTLEAGGEYRVPTGDGAPDFEYLTGEERAERREANPDQRAGVVAIERPEDADLPPAGEPFEHEARTDRGSSDDGEDEHRRTVQRYDLVELSSGPPPLDSTPQLLRLGAALLAVVALGAGGYLLSSK